MTEVTNGSSSSKYISWYLNDVRLNELFWRVTNRKLQNDILSEIKDNPFNNNYNVNVKLSNNINDIYILIGVLDGSQNIFHMTFHLLLYSNNSNNNIGPFHIRNNSNYTKASRINIELPQNISNERLIFYKSKYPLAKYSNISIEISELSNAILNVFNRYFSKDNTLSLDIITNPKIHDKLKQIIIYFKRKFGILPIHQTTFTKGQFGGKALTRAIEPAIACGKALTKVSFTRKKKYNKRKTRKLMIK